MLERIIKTTVGTVFLTANVMVSMYLIDTFGLAKGCFMSVCSTCIAIYVHSQIMKQNV